MEAALVLWALLPVVFHRGLGELRMFPSSGTIRRCRCGPSDGASTVAPCGWPETQVMGRDGCFMTWPPMSVLDILWR